MAKIDLPRLTALEKHLGARLPPEFLTTLAECEPIREGNVVLAVADCIWDVRTTFTIDDGDPSSQLDAVYGLVWDVLPKGMVSFAEDWGGNFYCLVLFGKLANQVVWWDHERDADDESIEPIAASVAEFYSRLVSDPRE
jgi:hypothetical protein